MGYGGVLERGSVEEERRRGERTPEVGIGRVLMSLAVEEVMKRVRRRRGRGSTAMAGRGQLGGESARTRGFGEQVASRCVETRGRSLEWASVIYRAGY